MAQEEPEERIVLGDASALIGLAAAGGFDLLQRLFGAFHVTASVRDEILAGSGKPGVTELQGALDAGWVCVVEDVPDTPVFPELGEGEASTLRAALAIGSESLAILDDKRARESAMAFGIRHVGTLGVILVAKRRGLIEAAGPFFADLVDHGFHIPESLLKTLLREIGEA